MGKKALKRKVAIKAAPRVTGLVKRDTRSPALVVRNGRAFIKAGTALGAVAFKRDTEVAPPAGGHKDGVDYGVFVIRGKVVAKELALTARRTLPAGVFGGYHFALGGNADAEAGGDTVAQINPCSIWDVKFRPACPDPRGMTLVSGEGGRFWCDIYLLCADHMDFDSTSRARVKIADGNNPPQSPAGDRFSKLDYAIAVTVYAHHGKQLLSAIEFFAAAYGVTEKTAHSGDPVTTGLDAARTSKYGLMQATGNMWVWGHCGHPTQPRASIFGGSYWGVDSAGSRFASLGYRPGNSGGDIGARGRSDHLQLA